MRGDTARELRLLCACTGPSQERAMARKHELVLALSVALKGRLCALGGAYPRACTPAAAYIFELANVSFRERNSRRAVRHARGRVESLPKRRAQRVVTLLLSWL